MCFYQFKHKILLGIFLLLFGITSVCLAATVDTQLSSDHITLSDSIFVTFILNNNATNSSPDFSVLQKDFHILNTNYSNAMTMINGVTSMQSFWRVQLAPKTTGELIIPEINFGNNKSIARKLMVTTTAISPTSPSEGRGKAGVQSNSSSAMDDKQNAKFFVRSEISSTSPYVQSQVLYTFKLYLRTQLRNPRIEMPQIILRDGRDATSSGQDVIIMQLEDRPAYQTAVNGEIYNVIEKSFALFPKKSGVMTISPMRLTALAMDDNATPFDDFFNYGELKPVSVASKKFNLTVRKIPSNYHGSTWLPAKNISLTEEWSNQSAHLEPGTPLTRTITIEAQGLRADQLPDLTIENINGVSVYVDSPKRSNAIQNNMIIGKLKQKVTYIPNDTQSFTILPLKITWWNTKLNSNAVSQLNAMTFQVKSAANVSKLPPDTLKNINAVVLNGETASSSSSERKIVSSVFNSSRWFFLACILFVAWMVTLALLFKKSKVSTSSQSGKTEEFTHTPSLEMDEKSFDEACKLGQAMLAQQYLLVWAKTKWQDTPPLNLASLRNLIHDDSFNLAVLELENVLYAKKPEKWHGDSLRAAFKRIKKNFKHLEVKNGGTDKSSILKTDPLPPLNPLIIKNQETNGSKICRSVPCPRK